MHFRAHFQIRPEERLKMQAKNLNLRYRTDVCLKRLEYIPASIKHGSKYAAFSAHYQIMWLLLCDASRLRATLLKLRTEPCYHALPKLCCRSHYTLLGLVKLQILKINNNDVLVIISQCITMSYFVVHWWVNQEARVEMWQEMKDRKM